MISPKKPRTAAWTFASRVKGSERRDMPFPAMPITPPSTKPPALGADGREMVGTATEIFGSERLGNLELFAATGFLEAVLAASKGKEVVKVQTRARIRVESFLRVGWLG